MSCIICFLTDSYQNNLRNLARQKADRFEDAIEEYKKLFISEFGSICDISNCHKHNDVEEVTKNWCRELHKTLQDVDDIPKWFEKLKEVYTTWVGGDFNSALSKLQELLDTQPKLFREEHAAEYIFFIRGRKSESVLHKEDLFHIPFNKRHLVSNQRFSITGLPLLYLGLSPVDIYHELRSKSCDLNDLYFSSFVLKAPSSLIIADLTNRFPHIYSTYKGLHDHNFKLAFDEKPKIECQTEFHKLILSSVCSFQILERFEGSSFIEEYVLPQLLSERVRQNVFDGLSYSSTRVSEKHCYSEEVFYTNKYRENVVLFTKYSENENHDIKLLDKFDISRPVRLNEMNEICDEEIDRLTKEIIELNNGKNKFGNFLDFLAEKSGIKFTVHYEKLMVKNGESTFAHYKDHDLGKIHRFLLYQHMLSVRNWLKNP